MIDNKNDLSLADMNGNTRNNNVSSDENSSSPNSDSRLGEDEEIQQETSSNDLDEDNEKVTSEDDDKTIQAGKAAGNTAASKLASNRRDVSEVSSRANEATDRNDSGSGGISAGGAKSGSSLQ
ncbi:MAG: hypothetical protein LH478_03715 [Chitinophagaceae bacterium]|nr:hypothetical protein [Chitinophagaceae bacterium]